MIGLPDKIRALSAKLNNLEEAVVAFLKANPNPPDKKVHDWAEKEGHDVHQVEAAIYRLATKFVKILTGGKSVEKGVTEKDFDPQQIKQGIKVELEHTPDEDVAKKIVLDHLVESPTYYDHLEEMESKFEHAG